MWKLFGVGAMQGLEIGCFNKSLSFISVSKRTMVVSTNLLFVMAVAVPSGLEHISQWKLLSVSLLTVGGLLQGFSTWRHRDEDDDSSFALEGNALAVVAMLLGACRWAIMQHLSQRSEAESCLRHMSKLQLVWRVTPSLAATCLSFAYAFEAPAFSKLSADVLADALVVGVAVLLLMSSEFMLVQLTSAVALNVAAALHNIPVALAGVVLFSERVHRFAAVGFCVCLVGAVVYTLARSSGEETTTHDAMPFKSVPEETEVFAGAVAFEQCVDFGAVDRREKLDEQDSGLRRGHDLTGVAPTATMLDGDLEPRPVSYGRLDEASELKSVPHDGFGKIETL